MQRPEDNHRQDNRDDEFDVPFSPLADLPIAVLIGVGSQALDVENPSKGANPISHAAVQEVLQPFAISFRNNE